MNLIFDWRLHLIGIGVAGALMIGAMWKRPPRGAQEWFWTLLFVALWPLPIYHFSTGVVEEARTQLRGRR